MRQRSPGAGNARELKVMAVLADEGWLCASRRHIGGAGDVLAIHGPIGETSANSFLTYRPLLIEVKSTAGGPWERFGSTDRQALVETAEKHGAEAWLYWWPPRGKLQRIHASEFPKSKAPVEIEVISE